MRKPVLFGYYWGLLVVGADLGTRLISDSLSGSQGYFEGTEITRTISFVDTKCASSIIQANKGEVIFKWL